MAMHRSMGMVYAAAEKAGLLRERKPGHLAKLLNVSIQRITNWEARGISKEGALLVQRVIGVDSNSLLDSGTPGNISRMVIPDERRNSHDISAIIAICHRMKHDESRNKVLEYAQLILQTESSEKRQKQSAQ